MRKLMLSLAPLFAVAAFAVLPSVASAVTTYGTCGAVGGASANCPGTEHFTAFVAEQRVPVFAKAVSAEFTFESTTPAGNGFKCKGLQGGGHHWNTAAGVGKSRNFLAFEECAGFGNRAGCTPNATGIIEGGVTDEVTGAEKVKVTVESGFRIECGGVLVGSITGSVTGGQIIRTAVLEFAAAIGLTFATEAYDITGKVEFLTSLAPNKKVYI
jgi:hypothetical protein